MACPIIRSRRRRWRFHRFRLRVRAKRAKSSSSLAAKEPSLSALVTYRWDAKQPVLHKYVEITNQSDRELDRLLNVRLGSYRTDAKITECKQRFT